MKQLITSLFLVFLSIGAFCQSEAIVINESFKNMRMHEVFATLKAKYQLKVAYDYESVKDVKVNKTIRSQDLETALTTLFENTNLEFQLTEDNRILVRKVADLKLSETTPKSYNFTFKGKIIDEKSNTPLAFATVHCPLTNEGCSTNEEGEFILTINSTTSEGTLSVQYLGYIPRAFSWKKGDNFSNLQIELQTKSLDFEEITILEKLPTVSLNQEDGSTTMNAAALNNLPSFIGGKDIFRSFQLLPGISASDDLSSELKIRGSSGDENMIILDGITLYKVDHYLGIFSAVNSSIINQVKVYKNAFPVEYGGRTAGVIDLSSHKVEKPKIGGGLQLDLLTSSAYVTIPLNDKMGLLLGGRITNGNVAANADLFNVLRENTETPNANNNSNINSVSFLKENPNFKFYDVNAKCIWQVNQKSTVSASFFKGFDQLDYNYERTFNTKNNKKDGRRDEVTNIETFNEAAEWDNLGASLQLNQQWSSKINTNINLAYSEYNNSQFINSNLVRKINRRPPPGSPPNTQIVKIDTAYNATNSAKNAIKGLELNIKNDWLISKQHQWTFGYHLVHNQVQFELDVDDQRPISNDAEGVQHSGYLQYNFKQSDKLNIGLGLRNTYYSITQKNYLSPRVSITYKATDELTFKVSCSKYQQFLRKNYREDRYGRTYDFWVLSNGNPKEFPISSSEQCMLGFNFSKNGFELDMEAYYKNLDGVTEFVPIQNGFQEGNVIPSNNQQFAFFNGTGVSKGIDVLLKKNSGNYTGWLAYTLSKTTNSFPQIDKGNPFPSQDDRRHQVKWVHQYRYKKFDFSATYIFSSGRPYTDLTKIVDNTDRREIKPEDRLSYLKDYQRIDIGASYRFNWGTSKARIGASIFNLLNWENVKYRQYIHSVPNERGDNKLINEVTGTELLMLGFTPNISFSLDF